MIQPTQRDTAAIRQARRARDYLQSLSAKFFLLIVLGFLLTAGAAFLSFQWVYGRVVDDVGMLFAEKQVLYDRERSLVPIRREVTLASMLAASPTILAWAMNEDDPVRKARGLAELETFRRAFSDKSYFFALARSRHYYFNDAQGQYTGRELRYTLNPLDEQDRWFFATLRKPEPCLLNVDFDEKIQVTKLWINCIVRKEGQAVGVIGTGIDLSTFIRDVVDFPQPNLLTMFIDETGAIQAHRNRNLIDYRSISKSVEKRRKILDLIDRDDQRGEFQAAMLSLKQGIRPAATMFVTIDGQRFLAGLTFIQEFRWFNVTLMGIDQVIREYFLPTALLLLAALLLFLLLTGVVVKLLVLNRISQLDTSVQAVTRGLYDVQLVQGPEDEIGRLGSKFKLMAHTVRDTTENLESKVAQRTAELQAANETKDRLLSIIGHDLRGPIGMVRSVTHELEAAKTYAPALLSAASGSADYAFELLEDLLQWASSQSGKLQPAPVRFSLSVETAMTLAGLRGMAREKSIDLRTDVPEDLEVSGDVEMIKTILRNLVTNAIKFSHDGTQVRIATRQDAGHLYVDVHDHGVGIPPATQARLFRVGERNISTPGTRKERGTGLGLIVCKEFAQKHGGDILLQSEPGKGSTFTLMLPLASPANAVE